MFKKIHVHVLRWIRDIRNIFEQQFTADLTGKDLTVNTQIYLLKVNFTQQERIGLIAKVSASERKVSTNILKITTNLPIVLNTQKNPYLNQATKKNLPNLPTQKNPRTENFKPKKFIRLSGSLEIWSTPPPPPSRGVTGM